MATPTGKIAKLISSLFALAFDGIILELMQTLTFPCSHCTRRMGVGMELMGRQVRCPHCREVVFAPSATTPSRLTPHPEIVPDDIAPPNSSWNETGVGLGNPNRSDDAHDFSHLKQQPQESEESIFAEPGEEDDSVFGSPKSSRILSMPEIVDSTQLTEPVPQHPDFLLPLPSDPITGNRLRIEQKTDDLELEPDPIPIPQVVYNSNIVGTDTSDSNTIPQPIFGFDSPPFVEKIATEPRKPAQTFASTPAPTLPETTTRKPLRAEPPDGTARRTPSWLYFLAGYAILMSIMALWGWLRTTDRGHPLSNIPDFFGEYRKAERDKVSTLSVNFETVPPELRVPIGGKLIVGDLAIEPLTVLEDKPTRVTTYTGNGQQDSRQPSKQRCLVLKVRLHNLSKDVSFHPMDPAYNRKEYPSTPMPLSGLIVGAKRFAGGPIPWPYTLGVKHTCFVGQEQDSEPLMPGKFRDTIVVSAEGREVIAAVLATKTPVLWNIHFRRGLTTYAGEDVSVGALVGVTFDAKDVKPLPADPTRTPS